jgi:hypothetical protein
MSWGLNGDEIIADARAAHRVAAGGDDRSQDASVMLTQRDAAAAVAASYAAFAARFSPTALLNAAANTESLKPAKMFGLNASHLTHARWHTNERLELLSEGEGAVSSWQEKPHIAFKSCESAAEPLSLDVGDALYMMSATPLTTANCLSQSTLHPPPSALLRTVAEGAGGMAESAFVTRVASTSTTCGAQSLQHSWIAAS